MELAREVVVEVTSSSDPADTLVLLGSCEKPGILGLAVNLLLLVASDVVVVCHGHELLDGSVREHNVTVLVIVRIHSLLVREPLHGVCVDAAGSRKTLAAVLVAARVKRVD